MYMYMCDCGRLIFFLFYSVRDCLKLSGELSNQKYVQVQIVHVHVQIVLYMYILMYQVHVHVHVLSLYVHVHFMDTY